MKSTAAADLPAIVIILKKTQGAVWSEAGRTALCPTLAWLRASYGVGQYELQLKRGNRIICMTPARCAPELGAPELEVPKLSERRPSGTERARVGIGLRGTALG